MACTWVGSRSWDPTQGLPPVTSPPAETASTGLGEAGSGLGDPAADQACTPPSPQPRAEGSPGGCPCPSEPGRPAALGGTQSTTGRNRNSGSSVSPAGGQGPHPLAPALPVAAGASRTTARQFLLHGMQPACCGGEPVWGALGPQRAAGAGQPMLRSSLLDSRAPSFFVSQSVSQSVSPRSVSRPTLGPAQVRLQGVRAAAGQMDRHTDM